MYSPSRSNSAQPLHRVHSAFASEGGKRSGHPENITSRAESLLPSRGEALQTCIPAVPFVVPRRNTTAVLFLRQDGGIRHIEHRVHHTNRFVPQITSDNQFCLRSSSPSKKMDPTSISCEASHSKGLFVGLSIALSTVNIRHHLGWEHARRRTYPVSLSNPVNGSNSIYPTSSGYRR